MNFNASQESQLLNVVGRAEIDGIGQQVALLVFFRFVSRKGLLVVVYCLLTTSIETKC